MNLFLKAYQMKTRKLAQILFLLLFAISWAKSEGLSFETRVLPGNHHIHILTVNPQFYKIQLVRALDSALGRESVPSIAKRVGATAAVNGGFFEMGGAHDGRASTVLKIGPEWVAARKGLTSVVGWDKDVMRFDQLEVNASFILGNHSARSIDGINRPPQKGEIILFSPSFNQTTLTPPGRINFVIKGDKLWQIDREGNTKIPEKGYVLSLPPTSINYLNAALIGMPVLIQVKAEGKHNPAVNWDKMDYILGGIPMLLAEDKILPYFKENNNRSDFMIKPHARTAFGVTKKGHFVFVVVDHASGEEVKTMPLNKAIQILKQLGHSSEVIKKLSLSEALKELKRFEAKGESIGLPIESLALFLKELGCEWAINLDGGSSSTLVYEGQIQNHTTGEEMEPGHSKLVQRVSDAIVILPRERKH